MNRCNMGVECLWRVEGQPRRNIFFHHDGAQFFSHNDSGCDHDGEDDVSYEDGDGNEVGDDDCKDDHGGGDVEAQPEEQQSWQVESVSLTPQHSAIKPRRVM